MTRLALAALAVFCVAGCAILFPRSGHETYIHHMSDAVGKHVSRTVVGRNPEGVRSRVMLPNGNEEVLYLFQILGGPCPTFFEVDVDSGIVVAWRFEGTEEDCYWPPS